MNVVAIVEGFGDVSAMPSLIAKTGQWLGHTIIGANPIRAGEWGKLSSPGSLESYLELAQSRFPDRILVALDLDDGCAMTERAIAQVRIDAWKGNREINVGFVFMVREYESIFLHNPLNINSNYSGEEINNPESIRDAKGAVKQITGRRYNEPRDQPAFTKLLDLKSIYSQSRCYRKFCKELTGMDYNELDNLAGS